MTEHRLRFLIAFTSGLLGAAGVALSAVAAHRVSSASLETAAMMLMVHAGAGLAIASLSANARKPRLFAAAGALMLVAVSLFSGDIALNTLAGFHLFPMAAPVGGSTLIVSWITVALLAAIEATGARREP